MLKNKDIDREILLKVKDDKEIIELCHSNRYFFFNVCDDNFFHRRLQHTYPDTITLKLKREEESWKRFYMRMMYYIFWMKETYKYEYTGGNPIIQSEILRNTFGGKYLLLLNAAKEGEVALIQYIMGKEEIPLRFVDDALIYATEYGHLNVVMYLIENGLADIHANNEGVLEMAAYKGHLHVVKYLISKGANPHIEDNKIIRIAHNYGHDDVYEYLNSLH